VHGTSEVSGSLRVLGRSRYSERPPIQRMARGWPTPPGLQASRRARAPGLPPDPATRRGATRRVSPLMGFVVPSALSTPAKRPNRLRVKPSSRRAPSPGRLRLWRFDASGALLLAGAGGSARRPSRDARGVSSKGASSARRDLDASSAFPARDIRTLARPPPLPPASRPLATNAAPSERRPGRCRGLLPPPMSRPVGRSASTSGCVAPLELGLSRVSPTWRWHVVPRASFLVLSSDSRHCPGGNDRRGPEASRGSVEFARVFASTGCTSKFRPTMSFAMPFSGFTASPREVSSPVGGLGLSRRAPGQSADRRLGDGAFCNAPFARTEPCSGSKSPSTGFRCAV